MTFCVIPNCPEYIQQAYNECRRIALGHYENFPVGSVLLPKEIRPDFFALYAFMRTADDLADIPTRSKEERLKELAKWRFQLESSFDPKIADNDLHPIFQALRYTVRKHNLTIDPLARLLDAFGFDARGDVRFATFDDLLWYCDRSANPVGELVLSLFGYRDKEQIEYSNSICTALQLLNFCQDIREDVENGRCYFALDELKAMGIDNLSMLSDSVNARKAVLMQLTHIRQLLRAGMPLSEKVHGKLRYELRAVIWAAMSMIRKIERIGGNCYLERPKLSKLEHMGILVKSILMAPGKR